MTARPLRSHSIVSEARAASASSPSGPTGECYVELMQAQMGENDHPAFRKVDLAELSWGDCDVTAVLTEMGAKVGTRAEINGDTSTRRSRYCARFPGHATEVAVVAYVLTRIAPFHHQIRVTSTARLS